MPMARTEKASRTQDGDESNRPEPDDDFSPDYRHDIIHGLSFRDQGYYPPNRRDDRENTTSDFHTRNADLLALLTDEQRCLIETLRHQNAQSAQRLFEDLRRRIEGLLEHEAYSGDAVLMQNLFDDETWDVAGVGDINGAQVREQFNSIISEGSDSGNGHGVDGSGGSTGCHQPNGTDGYHDDKVKQQ
jgi:hypothetical protein